jgi:trigger factor
MQQTMETQGALERRIDLTVPAEAIDKEVQTRLAKLARNIKMPGFRPGKVPMKMIAATYGAQVQNEVLSDKVGEAFKSAVSASKLRVAGTPKLEPRAVEGSSDLAFSATFEVFPEIAVGDLSGVEVQRAVCPVGDAEVSSTLEIMRKQRATYEDVARGAAEGDLVVVDFKGSLDGVPFEGGTANDFAFTVGQGRMLPEFESAVVGLAAGASRTFPLSFPADYNASNLAGKTAEFAITVKKVQQAVLPPVDEAFAKSLGIADGDLNKMRAEVRANLEREVASRLKSRTRDGAMTALLGATSFDVPRSLVEEEKQRLAEQARRDLTARGVDADKAPLPLDVFATQAERRVRLGLLVGEVVRAHGLQPRPDQIRKLVEELAQSYEKPQEVINWYLSDRKRLGELEGTALEENVTRWVLEKAKVVEVPVAFDELMGHTQR